MKARSSLFQSGIEVLFCSFMFFCMLNVNDVMLDVLLLDLNLVPKKVNCFKSFTCTCT